MHALGSELAGHALRECARCPLACREGGEVGGALDRGGGSREDQGRRVHITAGCAGGSVWDGGEEEGENGLGEEEGALTSKFT